MLVGIMGQQNVFISVTRLTLHFKTNFRCYTNIILGMPATSNNFPCLAYLLKSSCFLNLFQVKKFVSCVTVFFSSSSRDKKSEFYA